MTSELRHVLHELADDVPAVDVIDRALGGARRMRRRRNGVGIGLAVVAAAAIVAPIAFGMGPRGVPVGAVNSPSTRTLTCTGTSTPSADALTGRIEEIVLSDLAGYPFAAGDTSVECQADVADDIAVVITPPAGGELLWVHLVADARETPGLTYPLSPAITSTSCDELNPPPVGVSPSSSGIVGETPAPTPSHPGDAVIQLLVCTDGTPTTPMIFGTSDGSTLTAGAVYADHRAIIASSFVRTGSFTNPAGVPLTVEQLRAIATDQRLVPMIPTR